MATGAATFPTDGEADFQLFSTITDGFKEEICTAEEIGTADSLEGVYKGTVGGGQVAVKRHLANPRGSRGRQQIIEYLRGFMEHEDDNVVKLRAFCHQDVIKTIPTSETTVSEEEVVLTLLCYDYFPKGNLDNYLSAPPLNFDWHARFKMIKGICLGLSSLHTSNIAHLNLKPQNILLDEDINPKITDFVYARILGAGETHTFTDTKVGSAGYKDPEYRANGKLKASKQADIYALGVIILEITTRKKYSPGKEQKSASAYIKELLDGNWKDTKREETILSMYGELDHDEDRSNVLKCLEVGFDCVQRIPKKRPLIEQIVVELKAKE